MIVEAKLSTSFRVGLVRAQSTTICTCVGPNWRPIGLMPAVYVGRLCENCAETPSNKERAVLSGTLLSLEKKPYLIEALFEK